MGQLALSTISPLIVQSEIRSMSVECDSVGGINLAQGICDTEVPAIVMEQAAAAIRAGHNIYTRLDGIAVLRQAIVGKLLRHNAITADPETEVLVTSGATGAFYAACLALLNPGDEVLVFEPFYAYHLSTLRSESLRWQARPSSQRAAETTCCASALASVPLTSIVPAPRCNASSSRPMR